MWERLPELQMRVDFIWGELDGTIRPRFGEEDGLEMAFARLSTPGELIVIEGGDHAPYVKVDAFNGAVLRGATGEALPQGTVLHPWQQAVDEISRRAIAAEEQGEAHSPPEAAPAAVNTATVE